MATDYRTILVKRGSADDWAASTIPLQSGEWGLDETNRIAKMGDGFNLWDGLPTVGGDLPFDAATGLYRPSAGAPIPSVDVDTQQLPDPVRGTLAANLVDPTTPEGSAVLSVTSSDTEDFIQSIPDDGLWVSGDGDPASKVQFVDVENHIVPDRLPAELGEMELLPTRSDSPWDMAIGYRDSNNVARVFVGRRKDGTWYPDRLNPAAVATIVRWGDSLTANSTASSPALAALLGHPVVVQGIGGQTSRSIAARQGGVPTRVTVQGGVIPASGSVTVTLSTSLRSDTTTTYPVVIAGVAGVFKATDATTYLTGTFTRTTAGLTAVVPDGTPVQTGFAYRDMWPIFWYGRNNFKAAGDAEQVVSDLQGSLDWNARRDRALVFSIPPWAGEEAGTTARAQLDAVNAAIRDAFPREFVDVSARLRHVDLITAVGKTPTAQDQTDIGNGLTPTTFRVGSDGDVDAGHLGPDGYVALNLIINEIYTARGWK